MIKNNDLFLKINYHATYDLKMKMKSQLEHLETNKTNLVKE